MNWHLLLIRHPLLIIFDGSSGFHFNILLFDDFKLNHLKGLKTQRYSLLFFGSCTFDFRSLYFRSDSTLQLVLIPNLTWYHHNSFHFIWEELNQPMRIKQLRISKLKIRISSRKVKTKRSSRSEGTCAEGLNPTHNWLIYNPLYLRIVREQNIAAWRIHKSSSNK